MDDFVINFMNGYFQRDGSIRTICNGLRHLNLLPWSSGTLKVAYASP
jgi:hypothetical protein